MAVERLNIRTAILQWAYKRAGYSEVDAIEAFPLLGDWLTESKKPTIAQLQKFAAKFFVPFGYLFLQTTPQENIPFPMFRGNAGLSNHFDLNVYETVMSIKSRQDWLEEYLQENDIETCRLVNTVKTDTPVSATVAQLRDVLQLQPKWAFGLAGVEPAVGLLTQTLEQAGVFVTYNGVVGNNTHRKIEVSQCRGFALVSSVAPYIYINSADSKFAQMFTLIHETAHLMLAISAGHAGDEVLNSDNSIENYCDQVAAEFLVPADIMREVWTGNIKDASRKFKVSELVVARRAHDLKLLSDDAYRAFWQEYKSRPMGAKKESAGGSFYLTSVKRVGKLFAIHVRNAVNSRQLEYTEAYRLTGLYGKTYQQFMTNNI